LLIASNVHVRIIILKVNTNLFIVFASSFIRLEKREMYLVMKRSIAIATITINNKNMICVGIPKKY
jgi:chorismate-pyruvate lyase